MSDYLYGSARIRALENQLIGREGIARLVDAGGVSGTYSVLSELGVELVKSPDTGKPNREATLQNRLNRAYAEIAEDAPDEKVLELFRYPYDCNNVKAAIKCFSRKIDPADMLFDFGTVSCTDVCKMAETGDFEGLPTHMREAAKDASLAFAKTKNPQQIDLILDRACYRDMLEAAGENEFIRSLVQTKIDLTNLIMTVRVLRMKMNYAGKMLLSDALLPGGTLSEEYFTDLYDLGEKQLFEKLLMTEYGSLSKKFGESDGTLTACERLADNFYFASVKRASMIPYGVEVLAAYLLACDAEVRNIRIVLSGKEAGLGADTIRERIRDSYV